MGFVLRELPTPDGEVTIDRVQLHSEAAPPETRPGAIRPHLAQPCGA